MWRRFVPKKQSISPPQGDVVQLKAVQTTQQADELTERLRQMPEPHDLRERLVYYRTLLIAQTPQAVRAQWQMDAHKHGYHDRHKRLYELIDFNDTFVSLVLLTPLHQRAGLAVSLKLEMEQFCRKLSTPSFNNEQFEAIARGLGREIAVFTAGEQLGYSVRMTSRTQDAFGIDMMIVQPGTHKRIYIDCKTPSAFRHKLEDLVAHKRISEQALLQADKDDFLTHDQQHNGDIVPVTLVCIRSDTVGKVHDFAFDEPARFKALLERIFATIDSRKVLDIFAKKW
jgi:hypothetical protein